MISASYRNNDSYFNGRNSSNHHRHSRLFASQNAASSPSSNIVEFIYKRANKHHWAKLQSKIKQRLMAENISYIDDEEEVARRSMPPPPALYLSPPAFLESPQDKEERQRQQKLMDESRKKKEDKFEEYRDLFAKDFPKGMAAHYNFLTESIITDLERAIQNIVPSTSNVMTHYRVMKERLLSKHGPNSQKDAEETRKKLEGLHGDHRGWDVFLAAHDSLVEVLSKTPVRDTANNPVMQPVPIRPHLPVPPPTATIAAFIAYAAADAANQHAWELMHPNDKTMNHRPTDTAIKNNVMLALGTSRFPHIYSILHQRYRQADHANKTWADLRLDIELIITNNSTGTSRDPIFRTRERTRWDQPPAENRASWTLYDAYYDAPSTQLNHNGKRSQDPHHNDTQDVRAATSTTTTPPSTTKNVYPCSNCGADHRATECPDPKCYICQTILHSAAARQAHYLANHKHESKRARSRLHTPHIAIPLPLRRRHDQPVPVRQRTRFKLLPRLRTRTSNLFSRKLGHR